MTEQQPSNSIKKPFGMKEFIKLTSKSTLRFFIVYLLMWWLINLLVTINLCNEYLLDAGSFFILPVTAILAAIISRAHYFKKNLKRIILPFLFCGLVFIIPHFVVKLFFPSSILNRFIVFYYSSSNEIFDITDNFFLLGEIGSYLSFFKTAYILSYFIIVANLYIKQHIIIWKKGLINDNLVKAVKVICLTFLVILPISAVILMLLAPQNHYSSLFFSSIFCDGTGIGFFFSVCFLTEIEALLGIENIN